MATCRTCGAAIVWAVTDAGKSIPIDEAPNVDGNLVLSMEDDIQHARTPGLFDGGAPRYVSHFVTCPDAEEHRRK